jgi:hypothetical protein
VEDIPQNYSLIELQENEKEIELLIINDKKKKGRGKTCPS